jgi:hypothetical protein
MKRMFACAVALSVGTMVAYAADVKSGLGLGEATTAFNVKDVTGPSAGKSLCYRCQYGAKPVACVFTREVTPEVGELIAKLDAAVGSNKSKDMKGFVVLLTDNADEGSKALSKLAADKGIKNVPLTIYDGTAGPEKYKIAKDAAVTVLMWNKSRVAVNHAFASAKIASGDIEKVSADTAKILN